MPKRKRRWLTVGDVIPSTTPSRNKSSQGYVVLRWRVGDEEVRVYEHRLVAGLDAEEVHHINGIKTDNRPENIERITKRQHCRLHQSPSFDVSLAMQMYADGWSFIQLGAHFGVHYTNILRVLKSRGLNPRSISEGKTRQQSWLLDVNDHLIAVGAVERHLAMRRGSLRPYFVKAGLLRKPFGPFAPQELD